MEISGARRTSHMCHKPTKKECLCRRTLINLTSMTVRIIGITTILNRTVHEYILKNTRARRYNFNQMHDRLTELLSEQIFGITTI